MAPGRNGKTHSRDGAIKPVDDRNKKIEIRAGTAGQPSDGRRRFALPCPRPSAQGGVAFLCGITGTRPSWRNRAMTW
jgi:hypothetical protein